MILRDLVNLWHYIKTDFKLNFASIYYVQEVSGLYLQVAIYFIGCNEFQLNVAH